MQRFPLGVVTQDGDSYVGTCDEVGTTSFGRTVEEAFANLRVATWQHLERQHSAASLGDVRRSHERKATYIGAGPSR